MKLWNGGKEMTKASHEIEAKEVNDDSRYKAENIS
jgi:hypothetical protein